MSKIKFSLSKQLVLITLACLVLMILLISIVLPKRLEPYFENTVYSYLDKPLEVMNKNKNIELEYKNTIYIQYYDGKFYANEKYKEFLQIDDISEIAKYIMGDKGKFIIKGNAFYYSVRGNNNNRSIAITDDSYIRELRKDMLYITVPSVILIFLIILVLLLLWSNYMVRRIEKIKTKIDNIYDPDFNINNKKEIDDELKVLNTAIDKMKDMIQTKEQYEREMYQNISHDFKTPIMVVKSYVEAYNDNIESSDKVIKVTEDEMSKLEKKVKKMLELNKVSYLNNNKTDEKINIKKLFDSKIENYKVINNKIKYTLKCNKGYEFRGAEETWESIIDNIMSNAIRYAKEEIVITVNKDNIVFYNDGENIDEKIINKIFDSYVKGKKGEHGLGLSIVKKNLISLNYNIYARNLKKGVEFVIEGK